LCQHYVSTRNHFQPRILLLPLPSLIPKPSEVGETDNLPPLPHIRTDVGHLITEAAQKYALQIPSNFCQYFPMRKFTAPIQLALLTTVLISGFLILSAPSVGHAQSLGDLFLKGIQKALEEGLKETEESAEERKRTIKRHQRIAEERNRKERWRQQ